ncbi:efflux RND transporter periplasmic adaptor subunit [Luteimonas sp. BDR2-5]|uniref:efflux RND transporter periplasmic adaptor subunit n=1 Tax=Proluteimonas luteida TaxID=2878685 RepID=UPI001E628683|nr:efflux RND transporter periplasmic adaptor subunit [Luteimonas sp. BDR2-5]MCD9028895.1 efflux RND transporter periplasmic adaptor subunit [Luteimonas sp. BDR2-5]
MSTRPKPKRRGLPRLLIAVVVLAAAGAGLWFWIQRDKAGAEDAYRTTPVERGDIRVAISATGTLSATSTVTVGSQISGQITEVLVDFNDKVVKDQIIARIDPSTYQAQIEQGDAQIAAARASLAQARATLQNAELDYRRKADLGAQKLVAQSDVDLAKATLDQARAQIASTEAQIRQQTAATQTTQVNLDRTVIRSPVDGVVLLRSIELGQTVAASMTAPELFQIAEDLSKMKIELSVDESDIGQVEAGQAVSFTADAFPDRQFRGVVEQVRLSATTTNNVVTYPVVVSVDNSDGTLLPGLTVNAEIEVSNRSNVLKVSSAATRYKPADAAGIPMATPGGAPRGGGLADDLEAVAASMTLTDAQRSAFDKAIAAVRARQQAGPQRAAGAAAPTAGGPGPGGFGAGAGASRGSDPAVQAQMRQRMTERFQQDFAGFTDLLDDAQKAQWNRALASLVGATRTTLYRLVDGRREAVQVRIGATDGTSVEVSGNIAEGDAIVIGERAPR